VATSDYKVLELVISEGNFEQGFPAILLMSTSGKKKSQKIRHRLPPNPELPEIYAAWQSAYLRWGTHRQDSRHLRIDFPDQTTNISYLDVFEQATEALRTCLLQWFDQPALRDLRESILLSVSSEEPARLFIQTQDPWLRRLPWHLWPLLEQLPQLEVGISAANAPTFRRLQAPLKILAVLGSDETLNLNVDQSLLASLPNATTTYLIAPSRQELSDRLFEDRWDMLFFAGHSHSTAEGEMGYLRLNANEHLTPKELKFALRTAVTQGLQIAIFNSCDGLGLANALAELHIPYMIVMREVIPDQIAHRFLAYFLKVFAEGTPFYLAVRQARERLHGLENEYPCASWLPIICQNPNAPVLKYPKAQLRRRDFIYLAGGLCLAGLGVRHGVKQRNLDARISMGENLLFQNTQDKKFPKPTEEKKAGVEFMAQGKVEAAIKAFESALKQRPHDAEARIYLNNAYVDQAKAKAWHIAVSVPISVIPEVAQEILRGCAQFQTEFNNSEQARGQNLKIKLVIANDDNDPELASQIAQRFVDNPKILAVVGHNSSDASLQAAPIYNSGGLVMITPTSFADGLVGIGNYIFRMMLSIRHITRILAEGYVSQRSALKLAVCYNTSKDNESFRTQFISDLSYLSLTKPDLEISTSEIIFPEPNATAKNENFIARNELDRIHKQDSEINTLLLASHVNALEMAIDLGRAYKRFRSDAAKPHHLLGSTTLYTKKTLEAGKDLMDLVIVSPWHEQKFPEHHFVKKAKELWDSPPSQSLWEVGVTWRTAMAYDATAVIAKAIQDLDPQKLYRTGSKEQRNSLKDKLRSEDFRMQGATGTIEFKASGERLIFQGFGNLLKLQKVKGKYDFVVMDLPNVNNCERTRSKDSMNR
jgi:branched-chain amino acid transport system substrate-binding protein